MAAPDMPMKTVDSEVVPVSMPIPEGLFPLPLTPLEAFMFADTSPGYSMLCDCELQFTGEIDRGTFDRGLQFALERNPLLRSLVVTKGKASTWVSTERLPAVDWAPMGEPFHDYYDTHIDLKTDIGLRVHVRHSDERSTVLFQFHHACCDGIGVLGFVEDFLAGYATAHSEQSQATPRSIDPSRLFNRGFAGISERTWIQKLFVDPYVGAREGIRFFWQKPRPLAGNKSPTEAGKRFAPGFIQRCVDATVSKGLRRAASSLDATANDLLLRDLFVTLQEWNLSREGKACSKYLRILMPQNLRHRDDRAMPAANCMSFAFITRPSAKCGDPNWLLKSIQEETNAIKDEQLSKHFLGSLDTAVKAGILPWFLKQKMCFSTTVLTNLGDPTRRFTSRFPRASGGGLQVGNIVLDAVVGAPPLRPETNAAFAAFASGREMIFTLRCNPHLFTEEAAESLLDQFIARLKATASVQPVPSNLDLPRKPR
jgi:NRPS condensation-like uncharacterized protein